MPIMDYEKLTPNLEPLEDVEINLDGVHLLQLKSNFNNKEVAHFVDFLAQRMYAYQVLRFLDFVPEHDVKVYSQNEELIEDHTSQINKDAGLPEQVDFWKFTASIKDTLKNEFKSINNGEDSISVDWMLSCCFIDLTLLKNILLVNQEDLPFKEAEGCYYGRSVLAVCIQEYHKLHREKMLRNFKIIIPADEPSIAEATVEHLKKQRDLALNRAQTLDHLNTLKCQKTGVTGQAILEEGFTVFK